MELFQEYPRPTLERDNYTNLNGLWNYSFEFTDVPPETYEDKILVPYSPETKSSGVERTLQPDEWLHYNRTFEVPEHNGKTLLHFGAVDDYCRVEINGKTVGEHKGGYLPFTFDITEVVEPGENTINVIVSDATDLGQQSRGKQKLNPGGMYYPAQSGIWQTVWLEQVPQNYIEKIDYDTDIDKGLVRVKVKADNPEGAVVKILSEDKKIAEGITDKSGEVLITIPEEELKLWSPESPFLYDTVVTLPDGDEVKSYFAMRKFSLEKDKNGILRIFLNNKPYFLHGLLDQGYWPEGLYTPPSDQAFIDDIQTMKDLGFNLLRKHAKVEPERWYYYADKLGMVVWQDMVNGGGEYPSWFLTKLVNMAQPVLRRFPDNFYKFFARDDKVERELYYEQLKEMVEFLKNHPSIAAWVPFNEGWGQFDAKKATKLLKELDPTRLVDEASGWFDQGGGDFLSLHYYFYPPHIHKEKNRTVALTEYGGIAYPIEGHVQNEDVYGYGTAQNKEDFNRRYADLLMNMVKPRIEKGLSALVYTQVSDVEDEINGLMTYDREVLKLDEGVAKKSSEILFKEFENLT